MTENGKSSNTKIDWTFENICLVVIYIVILYGIVYHIFYTLPKKYYNQIRYGKLSPEYIKKFGEDYTFKEWIKKM